MSEMRVQRALARAGIASRRAAEELIRAGRVRVDGKVAELGSKADPDRQKITVGGKPIRIVRRRWLAFHKPLGVVTTASDEEGRRTVFDYVKDPAGLTYVGRLDVMTTGLLLLTTDGEALHRLRLELDDALVAQLLDQSPQDRRQHLRLPRRPLAVRGRIAGRLCIRRLREARPLVIDVETTDILRPPLLFFQQLADLVTKNGEQIRFE